MLGSDLPGKERPPEPIAIWNRYTAGSRSEGGTGNADFDSTLLEPASVKKNL
jgi:hypothetical protein